MKVLDVDGLKRVASNVKDKIAEEANIRQDVDASLSTRIGSAETDLEGLKSLTYGDDAAAFLEVDDGGYSSPALEEIQHEIETLRADGWYILSSTKDVNADTYQKLREHWPKCAILTQVEITGTNSTTYNTIYRPYTYGEAFLRFTFMLEIAYTPQGRNEGRLMHVITRFGADESGNITARSTSNLYVPQQFVSWPNLRSKPFSTIGSGLKVEDDALTVDVDVLTDEDIDSIYESVFG